MRVLTEVSHSYGLLPVGDSLNIRGVKAGERATLSPVEATVPCLPELSGPVSVAAHSADVTRKSLSLR